jgi:murein DD-endopeptidase MepM/ murein hydrolase activator NlpD
MEKIACKITIITLTTQRMISVKKAFTKSKSNHATFMYIPESESKVVSLRIPTWMPKAIALGLSLLLILTSTLLYMVNTVNDKYSKSKEEISSLAAVNASQKQEIEKLQNDAIQIQQQLVENIRALDEIKELVGLEKSTDAVEASTTTQPTEIDTSKVNSVDTTQQLDQIKTSYKELNTQLLSQKQLIESSMATVKKQVAYLNAMPSIRPVSGPVTDSYGYRKNPFTNRGSEFHKGIDFSGPAGTPIKATGDGVVVFSGWQSGYGNVLILSHGYGITTLYAHNSKLLVKKGEKVKKGQVISKMGSTGRSTGTHLHYEVRVGGQLVNPTKYIK